MNDEIMQMLMPQPLQPMEEEEGAFNDTESFLAQLKAQLGDVQGRREAAVQKLYTSPQELAQKRYNDMLSLKETTDSKTGARRKKTGTEKAKALLNIVGALGGAVSPNPNDSLYDKVLRRETSNYNSTAPNLRGDIQDMRLRENEILRATGATEKAQTLHREKEVDQMLRREAQNIAQGKISLDSVLKAKALILQGKKVDAEAELKRAQAGKFTAQAGMLGQQTSNLKATGGATGELGSSSAIYEMDPEKRQGVMEIFRGAQLGKGAGKASSGSGGSKPKYVGVKGNYQDPNTLEWTEGITPHWLTPPGGGGGGSNANAQFNAIDFANLGKGKKATPQGAVPQGVAPRRASPATSGNPFDGILAGPKGTRTGTPEERKKDELFRSAQGSVRDSAAALSSAVRSGKLDQMVGPMGAAKYEVFKHFPLMGELAPQDFTTAQQLRTGISLALMKHAQAQGARAMRLIQGMEKSFPGTGTSKEAIAGGLASYYALIDLSRAMQANPKLISADNDLAVDAIGQYYARQAKSMAEGGPFKVIEPADVVKILTTNNPTMLNITPEAKAPQPAAPASGKKLLNFLDNK